VPVGAPTVSSSWLGVALGWQHGRLFEPHRGEAGAPPPVLCVSPCRDGGAGPSHLPSVVSLSLGVAAYC